MEEEKEKNLDFDTILENYVGGGGKWQWSKIFWLAPGHSKFEFKSKIGINQLLLNLPSK